MNCTNLEKLKSKIWPKQPAMQVPLEPHNKLSTPLGRFIERLTYKQIALFALCVVLVSAVFFRCTAGGENGLKDNKGGNFGECLYFSVVTFTTVGYGELTPIGWGRLVAGIEVLAGLCLTALLIGKVASERQSALLLLIYTSDQQRRLSGFSDNLEQLITLLKTGMVGKETVEKCMTLTTSLQAYLMFQTHQGRLADFGNGSALRHLYRMMDGFISSLFDALNTSNLDPKVEEGLLKIARRVNRLATIMKVFHGNDGTARSTIQSIKSKMAEIDFWETKAVTPRRLEQVYVLVPPKPWPKHFHKEAAARAGISNALFRNCMNELIKQERI